MKATDELLESCVRAFEATTSEPADGRATRARVLEAAERRIHRRPSRLRARAPVFLAVILASATSAAVTSLVGPWSAPASVVVVEAAPSRVPSHLALRHSPRIPATAEAAGEEMPPEREADFYARAHRAHFAENAPKRALGAWDQYLEKYPRGTFVPEARYNRALCLVRLGRWRAAAGALRPIADGKLGSYRRKEAALLLDSLQLRHL